MNLLNINDDVNNALLSVEKVLETNFKWDFKSNILKEATFHLLSVKGKLLRPGLVFIGAEAIGSVAEEYIDLAIAIEYLHISSLIHDDIIDKDDKRRGKETVHVKYGIENAILAGDALIARAVSLSAKYGERVVSKISGTAFQMCDGEALDYSVQEGKVKQDFNGYLEVARRKTASLISTSLSIASIRENKEENTVRKLENAGENLGIAFQIRDDIINAVGSVELGRRPGMDDATKNRPNIVSVIMNEKGNKKESVETAIALMEDYVGQAISKLSDFPRIDVLKQYINEYFNPEILRNYLY